MTRRACLIGAPVLLGARGDFAREGDDAVGVGAIGAVELFQFVEISQMMAAKHQIVSAFDLGDAVDRKADRLKNAHENVEQHKGDDASVNHRRGQHHQRTGAEQIRQQLLAQRAIAAQQFLLERDAAVFQADAQFGAALGEFGVEFAFQGLNFFDQRGDGRRHVFVPYATGTKWNSQTSA